MATVEASGRTCWRRLRDGQQAGVWERVRRALLDRLGRLNGIDWGRCSMDSAPGSDRLGRHRWVVERTLAWFSQFRRLVVRYERRADIYAAFLTLAAALITFRFVERWFC